MSEISSIMAKINRRFGEGTMAPASRCSALGVAKIPTGSLALDCALNGGWPEGRIIELSGNFSACKTTLALATAREYLKLDKDRVVVFSDVERTLERVWLDKSGVDPERFYILNLVAGEQVGQALKDILFGVSSVPLLLIVDSLAQVVPTKELEDQIEDEHPGRHARLINKMMRVIPPILRRSLVEKGPQATVIFLNQVRQQMMKYGDPETTPGGKGKEFTASVRVHLRSGDWILDGKRKVGRKSVFLVKKSKTGPPGDSGEFSLYFRELRGKLVGRIDNVEAAIRYGLLSGIVTRKGPYYVWGRRHLRGEPRLYQYLSSDDNLLNLSQELRSFYGKEYALVGGGYVAGELEEVSTTRECSRQSLWWKKTARKRKSTRLSTGRADE